MIKLTLKRYMMRKHYHPTQLNKDRFGVGKLYSHYRPKPSSAVPETTNPDNTIQTDKWPT